MAEPPAGRLDAPVLVAAGRDVRPPVRTRRRDGRRVSPRLDARQQLELPGAPLDLPSGEREERGDDQQRRDVKGDEPGEPAAAQGLCNASWGDIGIMFPSMWYMTHIEPTKVMTTSVSVKTRARKVQPPSDFVFMCRK